MTAGLVLDTMLAVILLWLAYTALSSRDLFRGIVLFIAFGLVLSMTWARLGAPDVALAEAAIGAGLTGALLLATWGRLPGKDGKPKDEAVTGRNRVATGRAHGEPGLLLRAGLGLLLVATAAGLVLVLLAEPVHPGLSTAVQGALAASGTDNPVTAVLLNFRGYDTLMEIAVLTATLVGVWALGTAPRIRETTPSPILLGLNSVLLPLAAVIGAYLLWVGAKGPGGAFQAGAVLAAAGVLFILAGRRPATRLPNVPPRWSLVLGLAMFLAVAFGVMLTGHRLLEYPGGLAGSLILVIEAAATLSIAAILAGLFIGGRPEDEP